MPASEERVDPVHFDPFDPAVQDDPFGIFAMLRSNHPCYRDPDGRFVAISRYEDVREALHDHETFGNAGGIILGQDVSDAPPSMVLMDPPKHTRLRNLVSRAFTPRQVAAFEDRLRASVHEFVDAFAGHDHVDLVPAFADLVPVRAISDIVGVPTAERARFRELADRMIGEPGTESGLQAMLDCFEYFAAELQDRRTHPRGDLLTAMAEAEVDGEQLTIEEQIGMVLLLFFAGIETTVFHMSNLCYWLATRPELQASLRQDPSRISGAAEEVLRYDAPVQGEKRTVRRDVLLHGEQLVEGDVAFVLIGAANHDPDVFDRPEELDIERQPNPHLSFASGVHFCLGAPLVRLEQRVALEVLLERVPSFRAMPTGVRRRHLHGPFMRGFEAVPVSFG